MECSSRERTDLVCPRSPGPGPAPATCWGSMKWELKSEQQDEEFSRHLYWKGEVRFCRLHVRLLDSPKSTCREERKGSVHWLLPGRMVQEPGTLASLSSCPFAQFFQETYEWVIHRRFCKHVLHGVVWQDSTGNKCVCKLNSLFSERTWLFFPIITDFEKWTWETRELCKSSLGTWVWKQAVECCCFSITHSWGHSGSEYPIP